MPSQGWFLSKWILDGREALRRGLNALKAAEERRYRELLENQLHVLDALSGLPEARYAYNSLLNELVDRVKRGRAR
ncbi:MAG: hypothetical protein QXK12_06655 [Candidatus Nezhaarchaeales archaeon]